VAASAAGSLAVVFSEQPAISEAAVSEAEAPFEAETVLR
jgi:hypothetical protein